MGNYNPRTHTRARNANAFEEYFFSLSFVFSPRRAKGSSQRSALRVYNICMYKIKEGGARGVRLRASLEFRESVAHAHARSRLYSGGLSRVKGVEFPEVVRARGPWLLCSIKEFPATCYLLDAFIIYITMKSLSRRRNARFAQRIAR